jgi:CheY-specific phosphatase CheX
VDTARELVEAFSEAVPAVLREMAGVEAVIRDVGSAAIAGDLVAVVNLTMASGEGRMALVLPARTAADLTRRILAGAVDPVPEDMVRDCMGEVANVAAGQAKVFLVGRPSHFTLSTPAVRGGPVDPPAGWVIRFDSDAGEFGVYVEAPGGVWPRSEEG